MKNGKLHLRPIALAVMAVTALAGCNDDTTIIEQPTQDSAVQMREVFTDYKSAMKTLDSTNFGQVTDQMAASRQSVDLLYLDKLEMVDRDALSDEDKIYYDTFLFDRNISLRGASLANTRFGNFSVPITHFYNYIEWNAEYAGDKQKNLEAYRDQIQVIREYTSWVNNLKALYSLGIIDSAQLPKVLITRLVDATKETVAKDNYALLKVGLNDLKTLSGSDFTPEYEKAVDDSIAALGTLISFLEGDYYTAARGPVGDISDTNIGWGDLPNGQAWYQWQLDRNSTTGKPAMELSQLGEELVADAKAEMERVAALIVSKRGAKITANWHNGTSVVSREFVIDDGSGNINLSEFFDYLNSEQFFYGRDGRTITGTEYATLCATASDKSACEAALTDYNIFKTDANDVVAGYFKPIQADYTVVPTPASREAYAGVASYGNNEFNLNTNPNYSLQKWNVSTLLLHEAAPGHHFQNAYSIEYPPADKPDYIKGVWYTAYAEGWALYTEWLGLEMKIYGTLNADGKPTFVDATGMCKTGLDYTTFQGGIYNDVEECNALQYFGSLNEAQLRNMRLAVDTGIHAKGWSIEQARTYMSANSALGVGDIESETYRYAAYVGQAVSYKSGYLVIKSLLEKAQTELGDNFDWAAFHDQLLKYGDQPMEVVETSIENWIKTQ
ncbi:DUF885 domain-containing protein [Vibrio genomosp. F6]|uniref:DUF885 domain-containing protein n=1 Tax=Vibrio TaxID=662 RepID=UPI000DEBCD89|nr:MULTISPECIES: DUF885 domain-containing protein [Vibrio]MDN3696917.1 DUF885 domain-containing protein [Vibrio cortegadensis]RBW66802.1 DUF885 domain-containing protein [Vibrionales bacterium C3R12]TKF22270.1 DUF885 domain-containing protein [Vibrio genomosp. F6]